MSCFFILNRFIQHDIDSVNPKGQNLAFTWLQELKCVNVFLYHANDHHHDYDHVRHAHEINTILQGKITNFNIRDFYGLVIVKKNDVLLKQRNQ